MKRLLRYLALIALIIGFFSCQKELSLEFGNYKPVELDMAWEFRDTAKLFKGTFDTAYLQSQGTLQALTLEGFSEDGTGSIFLQLIGDPLQPGVYTADAAAFEYTEDGFLSYTSIYGPDVQFIITVSRIDSAGITATFSGMVTNALGEVTEITEGRFSARFGAPDDDQPLDPGEAIPTCEAITVHGTYAKGVEMTTENYVVVPVSVITPGSWSVMTEEDNGLTLFGEGELEGGDSEIILFVTGTPTEAIESLFEIHLGPLVCQLAINTSGEEQLVGDGPVGSLRRQEKVPAEPATDELLYYEGTARIGQIDNDQIRRKIFYNGQNNIDRIDYYTAMGFGNYRLDARHRFRYHANGQVFAIMNFPDNDMPDTLMTYYWNSNNTLSRKVRFSGWDIAAIYDYTYTAGNLTRIVINALGSTKTIDIEYDNRENKFSDFPHQYPYLDRALIIDQVEYYDAFYYSANYPVSIAVSDGSSHSVDVSINPNRMPVDVKADGQTVYRFFYY